MIISQMYFFLIFQPREPGSKIVHKSGKGSPYHEKKNYTSGKRNPLGGKRVIFKVGLWAAR